MLVGLAVSGGGCRACAPGPGAQAGAEGSPSDAGSASFEARMADALGGHPLVVQARRSWRGGAVDPEIRARLLASTEPELSRTRAVLRAIDAVRSEADATATAAAEDAAVPVVAPSLGSLAVDPSDPVAAQAGTASASASAGTPMPTPVTTPASASPGSSSGAPASTGGGGGRTHSVISRGVLTKRGEDVVLRLHASGKVLLGTVDSPTTRTVHLMADGTGATASLLEQRGRVGGVTIASIRKGSNTVQFTIQLAEGWRMVKRRALSDGAEIVFSARD